MRAFAFFFLCLLGAAAFAQDAKIGSAKVGASTNAPSSAASGCSTPITTFGTDSAWEHLGNGAAPWLASSNQWSSATTVCTVKVWLQSVGSPVGNITAYIYSEGASVPGSVLSTSSTTLAANTISASETAYLFVFPNFAPSAGTAYWVALNNSVSDAANYVNVRMDGASSGGAIFQSNNGSSWGSYDGTRGFFMTTIGAP